MNDTLPKKNDFQPLQPEGTSTQDATAAEQTLLRHLAFEGVLAAERDELAQRHQQTTQALAQARVKRAELIQAVQAAGGQLPSWEAS